MDAGKLGVYSSSHRAKLGVYSSSHRAKLGVYSSSHNIPFFINMITALLAN